MVVVFARIMFLLFAMFVTTSVQAKSKKKRDPSISEIMKKAATEFPSIKAAKLRTKANRRTQLGTILDSVSLIGGTSDTRTKQEFEMIGSYQRIRRTHWGIRFKLSLSTFGNVRLLQLQGKLKQSAFRALQIQTAIEAGSSAFDYRLASSHYSLLKHLEGHLTNIKKGVKLSPNKMQLLQSKIVDLKINLSQELAKIEQGAIDIRRLIKYDPYKYEKRFEEIELAVKKQLKVLAETNEKIRMPQEGFLQRLEKNFPIPETHQRAFAIAKKSGTALVNARIHEKMADVQWFLTGAKNLPFLAVQVTKDRVSTMVPDLPAHKTNGETITLSANVNIGGGALAHLNASGLLREAAMYDRYAVDRNIAAQFEQYYLQVKQLYSQLETLQEPFFDTVKEFYKFRKPSDVNDKNFDDFIRFVEAIDKQAALINNLARRYYLTKIRILGLMGTLMRDLDKQIIREANERKKKKRTKS